MCPDRLAGRGKPEIIKHHVPIIDGKKFDLVKCQFLRGIII